MGAVLVGLRSVLVVTIVSLLLTGCAHFSSGNPTADYPEAEQFPQIYQAKMMAAAHWQLIAENEASLLARRFPTGSAFTLADSGPEQSTSTRSDFAVAYHHMLSQGLLSNQMRVFDRGADFQLTYHIQVLSYRERTQQNVGSGFYTGSTVVGFLLAKGLQISRPGIMLFPIAVGLDAYNSANSDTETPNTEIILTTTARANTEVVYSNSSVYYFRAVDQELYDGVAPEAEMKNEPRRPEFKVAGPNGGDT
ncbi:hypothetical protein [Wenzhouxiangella limi]|uniref:Uncharacterized protein n=1 Tax=Wenzhouxiangella limi TaxID=2707351 RepID=A0A845V8E0_9GAMM|nr:hypothetical protein [Wenzhouxiangella limi]NDY96195.1 hypothetical protein [Wenzhouxiangella limi]